MQRSRCLPSHEAVHTCCLNETIACYHAVAPSMSSHAPPHRQAPSSRNDPSAGQPATPSRRQALLGAAAVSVALAAASPRPPPASADYMKAPEGSAGPAGGDELPPMDAVKRIGKVRRRAQRERATLPERVQERLQGCSAQIAP